MNYDAQFCQQIRVSEGDKRQCLALISKILLLANNARNYGLLSLGKEAEESTSFLLGKGLQLALDGVKPHTARMILELYIFTGDYTGKDLLERCIILEGVMGILEGMHPKLLKELLLSFLGESGHSMYKEGFEAIGFSPQVYPAIGWESFFQILFFRSKQIYRQSVFLRKGEKADDKIERIVPEGTNTF